MKRKIWLWLVTLGVCWLMTQSPALAFDTGHHADLTRDVMWEEGFNQNAIDVAQVENWLVDYYSSQPTAGLRDELAHLHFDNLFTDQQVRDYWAYFTLNTQQAVEAAVRGNDPVKVIALLGMSLHGVQDFYTHSNWVALYPSPGNRYATNTWFSTDQPRNVVTGRYDRPGFEEEHGDYFFGLNKDSYSRPNWDKAYVFAYAASYEWVGQVKDWVEAVNPQFWNQAIALQLSKTHRQQLDRDLEAAYRVSEWIDVGATDGHWKGKGSGSNSAFVAFTAQWTSEPDSIYVDHFKEKGWFRELLPGLDGTGSTPPMVTVKARPVDKLAAIVRTVSVAELPVGFFESRIDTGGDADFYGRVTVQGQSYLEAMQIDRKQVNPDWTTIAFIDPDVSSVSIRYELWDEDGGPRGEDDAVDINPRSGYPLTFQLNPTTRSLSGDLEGVHDSEATAVTREGNERDRAQVKLYVTTKALSQPSSLSLTPELEQNVTEMFPLIDQIAPRE